jgi:outer membrane protein TolC
MKGRPFHGRHRVRRLSDVLPGQVIGIQVTLPLVWMLLPRLLKRCAILIAILVHGFLRSTLSCKHKTFGTSLAELSPCCRGLTPMRAPLKDRASGCFPAQLKTSVEVVEMPASAVVIVCIAVLLPLSAFAQTAPAGPLTLEQVLELAEVRSETVAIARAGIRRAEGDEVRARSGLFPQLNVAVSYDRALASEFEGVFDNVNFGAAPGGEQANGDEGLEDLPFGRKNTWRVNLSFSQNLFSGGRIGAQRQMAVAGRETALIGLTTSRAQLLFEVTQAYYDAALSGRLVAIAEATVGQATATLQQTEAAFQAGTQPEFEVLRARVSRDTQNPNLIRQRVNREVALLRLKQLLDLPADSDIELADALGETAGAPPLIFASRVLPIEAALGVSDKVQVALSAPPPQVERAPVKEAATTVRLREAALASVKAQRMPSVALTSTYGRVGYPSNVLPTFDRLNWNVGVTMQVPILTGGRQRGDEIVAEAELEQTRVQLRRVEELTALDTRSALAELIAARASWEATAGTVQQATRAYEIAEVRYQAGVSTQLELSDSRLLLQQAEANRAQAGRDLQVARARVALLPDLPLGVGAGPGGALQFVPQPAPAPPPVTPPAGNGQFRNAAVPAGTPQQFGGQ